MNGAAPSVIVPPLVSVVVPVFNVESYLRNCLESVLHQTLREWELICVDDGSHDGSRAVLDEYAARDSRVIVLARENGGPAAARNTGLAAARGEFIQFLDADDWIEPDALERLRDVAHALDLVLFDADVLFEDEALRAAHARFETYYRRSREYGEVVSGAELFAQMRPNGDYKPSPCLLFIRRDYVEGIPLQFREGILHEDNLFTLQCLLMAPRVRHLARVLYHRRIRAGSIMTRMPGFENFRGRHACVVHLMRFLAGNAFAAPAVAEALREIGGIVRGLADAYLDLAGADRERADVLVGDPDTFSGASPALWGALAWELASMDREWRGQLRTWKTRAEEQVRLVAAVRERLARQEAWNATLTQQRADARHQAEQLAERLAERGRQRAELKVRVRDMEQRIRRLEEQRKADRARYEHSISWRITRPLRMLGRWLGGSS